MAEAFLAYPELRNPFETSAIHESGQVTVLYQGKRTTLSEFVMTDELMIQPEDLSGINGFELKPEGACYEDVCIPIPDHLWFEQDGKKWFSLTGFAGHVGQAFVADSEAGVWSFAEIPARRDNMMINGMAPDFELTDRQGNVIRRADLKGRKALIVTWSSW